ncbi:hypothetical protein CP_0601 [Chlamydia pneumoniae AR39]|uniref:Uncharacterized protein n=1 Tax=Chlamydia pneumoniae TaxID=83558 RepID=Q9K236_CHLPN|nr:hypothetical protein CP_0601 [Chlamydia pneumoniae AR39]
MLKKSVSREEAFKRVDGKKRELEGEGVSLNF